MHSQSTEQPRETDTLAFPERLLASSTRAASPFITVAIPHYKHRRHLEIVLESLFAQSFDDFEILISDDCSPDDSNTVIPAVLEQSGRMFRYYAQPSNLGYDGNVRFCLRAAAGRYVFLLGNDDALAAPETLALLAQKLIELDFPDVAFTNYEDWKTGELVRKAVATSRVGSGPLAAIQNFRSFSFVSGAIYKQKAAVQHETNRWDDSIYYQIYVACRILAAGGSLGTLDISAVRKDVRIDDQTVPNYASKWAGESWSLKPRHSGLDSVIRVTADAVLPMLPLAQQSATLRLIIAKVLTSTYAFWLFEYRRVSNWSFSLGIARDLWPGKLLAEYRLKLRDRIYLWLLYLMVTCGGLLIPISLLNGIRPRLTNFLRRRQQSSSPNLAREQPVL